MAKSFEGLSRMDPRGLEPAGRESPREPLLTAGRARSLQDREAAGETVSDEAAPSLCVSVATLGMVMHLFFFTARKWLTVGDGGGC